MSKIRIVLITSPIDDAQYDLVVGRLKQSAEGLTLFSISPSGATRQRPSSASPRQTRLTPRHEILRELAMGQGVKLIGRKLGISPKTVETHRQEIKKRIGAPHLPGLVRYALLNGILSPSWLSQHD